jgi:DNA polymerase III delta subunit
MDMPSPVLILGDRVLSRNNINAAKRKYKDYKWLTFSANNDSADSIRAAVGQGDFLSSKKVILIQDLPNKKSVRDFLLDLVQLSSPKLKFIIWDSEGTIKTDQKKKTFNKTWNEWINDLKKNKDHKIVNNGENFSDKENNDCTTFIQNRFKRANKKISTQNALLLAEIVGRNRGMLDSEINKLLLTCPDEVTEQFIVDNAFPSSDEAILYKFGNVLDTCSYGKSITMMQKFLDMGINENVLADIMARKARWQLAAASLWSQGQSWVEVVKSMMQMGKYPSSLWHQQTLTPTEKRKQSDGLKDVESRMQYITKVCGLRDWQVDPSKKTARAEVVPMEFMAELTTQFLRNNIIAPYINQYQDKEMKNRLVDRGTKVYLFVLNKLKEIRYGKNPRQDLQEMVAALTSKTL